MLPGTPPNATVRGRLACVCLCLCFSCVWKSDLSLFTHHLVETMDSGPLSYPKMHPHRPPTLFPIYTYSSSSNNGSKGRRSSAG
ncbi:hypothetical protein LZ30DRAFT_378917 [Colletotrichum cereale]|nr:hypothetical protein LZ30DRAFT_378917 [Colletotrichum cereale]